MPPHVRVKRGKATVVNNTVTTSSVLLALLCSAVTAAEPLRFDFSPPFLPKKPPHIEATGPALAVDLSRSAARPGDRWIEASLRIQPPGALDSTRISASLYKIGEGKAAAEATTVPARNEGKLFADLRSLGLSRARLCVLLSDGRKVLGASEVFLSVRSPETALVAGQRIPVLLDLPQGVEQVEAWPVTFGVPFPAGTLWGTGTLRLVDDRGSEIPSQKEVTGLWANDGAIQWVRFDALASSKDGCHVEVAAPNGNGEAPLVLTERDGRIELSTGVARYVLGKGASPIQEVWFGGRLVAADRGTRGLYVVDQTGRTVSASADGETMQIEARGPVAACVRFEGFYKTAEGEALARHITRVEAFAGQPFAKITHTLVLTNDTNEVWFRDLGWELAVEPGADPTALFGTSRAEWQKSVAQPLEGATPSAYMLQDEHYRFAHGTNHFLVARMDAAGEATTLEAGEECGDWAALAGTEVAFAVCCKESARQHPKEFEVLRDRIVLHLFSSRGGEELDFRPPALIEKWDLLNWYEKTLHRAYVAEAAKSVEKVRGYVSNAIGWSKTHELLLSPVARADADSSAARLAYLNRHPVHALVDPQWIGKSEVMGPLHPRDVERFPEAEKYIDDTFRLWEKRIADWGEYGFVDYFAGPHLSYPGNGKYVQPKRYAPYTYTLRADVWRTYARSGDRRMREFAEATNRCYHDNIMAHWDGNGKIKGLFLIDSGSDTPRGDRKGCLPFYWEGMPVMNVSSSTNMDSLLYPYHLTGDRRARDVVLGYAEGAKRFWTPSRAKRDARGIMTTRMLAQAYGLTWDPALREMAEATTDAYVDPEGAIGLSKERPYRWSTYKTRTDLAGLLDAWRILGDQRYYDISVKVSQFWWRALLGVFPIFYTNPQGTMGDLLYRATGDPSYPEMLGIQVRQAGADYRPGTDEVVRAAGAHAVTFVFQGIPYSQDLIVRSGADKACIASWVAYEDFSYPTSIVAWKADQGTLNIDLGWSGTPCTGTAGGVRVRAVKPPGSAGLGLNVVTEQSAEWNAYAQVSIPKDAPECAYEILPTGEGFHIALAHSKVPLVLHAPEYWRPLKQVPSVKWYFSVPKDAQDAQIFFEGATKLYDPQGEPWRDDKPLRGWVDVPEDKPGIWAMEPLDHRLVCVRNLPPFFAARDPQNYFTPEIPWERQKPYRPPEKLPADRLYIPGAIETPGNQALHLAGKRWLRLEGGAPHPSGDGTQFLPFKQGTIEFFMTPEWSTFDLPDKAWKYLVTINEGKTLWYLAYNKNPAATQWTESHVLAASFATDGPGRRIYMRTWRQTILSNEEWVHVAWVWGRQETGTHTSSKRELRITTRIFVNGKGGLQRTYGDDQWRGNDAADQPRTFQIEQPIDELRISDAQRYKADFTPPPRDRELQLDKNTRALFHFNGSLDGESFGHEGPLPAQVK